MDAVGIGEGSEELHIATAKLSINFFKSDKALLGLFKILLDGVKHFHTTMKS